ncbi:amidohydrolase [Salinadaptatus halalkaliphilus]|uniref:Amidohydrolase n=1 Tax=Salinadaptatus halalkaliphilus TaxID=2419781 RepID=A0A4V3VLD2_9EURY|nr:amidohydrolase family protein [Salinadaptatus halalkaliphilus]THE65197.1 amidohydrolase [Salinadaptatus halalkaliphilus]
MYRPPPVSRRPGAADSDRPTAATVDTAVAGTDDVGGSATRRRTFLGAASAGTLATVAGCFSDIQDEPTPESADSDEPLVANADPDAADDIDDLPLFDAHVHITPMPSRGYDALSVDHLVDWMDDNDVDYAAVQALESPEAYPVQTPSWWILEETAEYDDRLVPFCTIDPRTLAYEDDTVEEVLESYLEEGMAGFGELKAGVPIDHENAATLYELCADYELPVLFHTDETAMTDEIGLRGLEDVVASFPDVDFVAHAHGWWIHISGDVDTMDRGPAHEGPVEPGGRVPELLAEYDNLYGDISAGAGWNALSRDEEFTQEFLTEHHEQLVFGTDYLFPEQEIPHFDIFEEYDLDLEAWADIRYRNFEGLVR